MIYLTQLIFIKKGKESAFNKFEDHVLPLIEKHKGKIIYRLKPARDSFISDGDELPDEIHFISFESENDFLAFTNDPERLNLIHLKEESVKSTLLVKGQKI